MRQDLERVRDRDQRVVRQRQEREAGLLHGHSSMPAAVPWMSVSDIRRSHSGPKAAGHRLHCRGRTEGVRRHEEACAGGRDRRRRRRRQHPLSPDAQGLVGRRAPRARRADRRLDLARRRPAAALQHELHGRAAAQVLDRPLQAPPGRDRAGRQLPRDRQPAPRDLARPHGRVPEVLRHGEHDRRPPSRSSGRSR